jgi:hypothetical protein
VSPLRPAAGANGIGGACRDDLRRFHRDAPHRPHAVYFPHIRYDELKIESVLAY